MNDAVSPIPSAPFRAVTLAICTCNRPEGLARTLASIALQTVPEGVSLSLLVVENSRDPALKTRAHEAVAAHPGARVVDEPQAGFPFARNRAMDEAVAAGAHGLIFIDDDQTLPAHWLATVLRVQAEEQADVVRCAVAWELEPPGRLRAFFGPDRFAGGPETRKRVRMVSDGGALIGRRLWGDWGLRLETRDTHSLGKDTAFFLAAAERGAVMIRTEETYVLEFCPSSKQTARFLLRRSYASGMSEARLRFKGPGAWRYALSGAARALWHGLTAAALSPWRDRSLAAARRAAKGAGLLMGALGRPNRLYETIHGK